MLAALIASQSLVALVSAAPTPKEYFVVNLDKEFVEKHKENEAFLKGKCLIAKDPKNDCTTALTNGEFYGALDFLVEHKSCKALTTKLQATFELEGKKFDRLPIKAFCYLRARACDQLTKANFPNYKEINSAKSVCSKPKEVAREDSGAAREKTPVAPVYLPEVPEPADDWERRHSPAVFHKKDGFATTGTIIHQNGGNAIILNHDGTQTNVYQAADGSYHETN